MLEAAIALQLAPTGALLPPLPLSIVAGRRGEADERISHSPSAGRRGGKLVGVLSIRDAIAARLSESRDEVNFVRDAVIAARHL